MNNQIKALAMGALMLGAANTSAQNMSAVLNVAKPTKGAAIASTMYGIFFEDINYAADGGLYAEMIKNRSFEFPQAFMGWRTFGGVELRNDGPFDKNPHYVRLSYAGHPHKHTGLENEGFFGISPKEGETYRFSVWARCPEGGSSTLTVQFVDNATMGEHQSKGQVDVLIEGTEWKKYTAEISSKQTIAKGALRIFLRPGGKGKPITVTDVEHISLFPKNTWKGRENGMRQDLAQALCDLKPGIFRFPGGCIVEGTDLDSRYQWKNTVGPVENRPLNENRWHYTFNYRFYPDYYQSYGLGFFEFFQLCEDFGSEALPVLSCGLACQFQNENHKHGKPDMEAHVAMDDLQPYIDDALDLIEFANGSTDTKWGKVRADMGHPEPFNLKYLGIGNEQWDYEDAPIFTERLKKFSDAIRKAHPEIKLIGTTGPDSEGGKFELLQPKMKELKVDLYDEHFYRPESWFLKEGNRYDNYDRKGPKIFAGEYACHGKGKKWNHFNASLLEAAFMTGIERNADIVNMATYAPLFAHVEGWQWRPDMIWYDNLRSVRTASYYVQQLYSLNKGTHVLSLLANGKPLAGNDGQNGLFASAVYDAADGSYIVKVANTNETEQTLDITLAGLKKNQKIGKYTVTTLHTDNLTSDNTLDAQEAVVPQVEARSEVNDTKMALKLAAKTFYVIRFTVK